MERKHRLNSPFFEIGPKNYLVGEQVIDLARIADEASVKYGINVIFTTPYADIRAVAQATKNLYVFAPHMDYAPIGRGLANVLPESIKAAGAVGVMLNHSERPLEVSELCKTVARARDLDIMTIVCADTIAEAKAREPRLHCYFSNVYAALATLQKLGKDNLGITLDVGHAYIAHENPAEAVAACKTYGDKLFHMHLNDNFGVWDDDCMVGANHILETIELMYWLKRTGYDGWFSFDQYTPRLDGKDALVEGAAWLDSVADLVDKIPEEKMVELFNKVDAIETSKLIRSLLFK